MKKEEIRYVSVPLHILQTLHKDKKDCLNKIVAYELFKRVSKGETLEEAVASLGFPYGEWAEIYLITGQAIGDYVKENKDPTPHLKVSNLSNFYNEDKTTRELDYLACDLACKSIYGKYKYKVTNYDFILTRMLGFSKSIPEELESHLEELKMRFTRPNGKTSNHKMRNLIEELEVNNFRVLMLSESTTKIKMKGILIGNPAKTTYEEMYEYLQNRKMSNKKKKLKEKKLTAIEKNRGSNFEP